MPSRQTQEVPLSLGSLGIPVFKVNYEGNKHLTVLGLACPYPKAISSDMPRIGPLWFVPLKPHLQ